MRQYGIHQKRIFLLALVMAAALALTGCSRAFPAFPFGRDKGAGGQEEFVQETLGLVPDFSYERKAEIPGVRVDRLGYLPESAKTAVFWGEELPETFQVIAKDTGECVYEGSVRADDAAQADGIRMGYGTFTELGEEGSYYIQSDLIGCSYYFTIGQDVYLEKAKELAGTIEKGLGGRAESGEASARQSVEICRTLSYLLVAYEMYPALFEKIWDAGIAGDGKAVKSGEKFFKTLRTETDVLLSIQDERTGGVYREARALAEKDAQPEISAEATAVYAGTMAKYSYLYQEYDWDYANICLKAAAKAWHYLDREAQRRTLDAGEVEEGRIYAASELYRASNEQVYHRYILQNGALMESGREDLYLLIGKLTYLSTKRAVERELCGQIMGGLMKGARKIAAEGKTEMFLAKGKETDVILWEMTNLALANYAVMNHEYVTVIENTLHYLMGRNEQAALLLEETDGVEAARMMLLFGIVEAERKIIEETMKEQAES